jgi:hypothetical protein
MLVLKKIKNKNLKMMHPVWYFVLWQHLTHLYFIEDTVTLPIYFDSLVGPGSSYGPRPQGFLYHCSNKLRGAFFVTFGIIRTDLIRL